MTLTEHGYKLVAMPRPDGAPFLCNLGVHKPPPAFWDDCGAVAAAAYRKDATPGLQLRCPAHRNMED